MAQDLEGRAFCYSNADLRKGEESEKIFNFIAFWKRVHGALPKHLVFDSKLTTLGNLVRLDDMPITFMTLRARSPNLLKEVVNVPRSELREVELDVPTRKVRFPKVYEQAVAIEKQVLVHFHRRAHLPIIIDSGLLNRPVCVPWWNGASLRMVA